MSNAGQKSTTSVTGFLTLMDDWAESWAGMREDVAIGQSIVEVMRPFIIHLREQGLTRKTVRRHLDNLWSIGGEIIRNVNCDDSLRHVTPSTLLLQAVELGEAPLLWDYDEAHQRECDATARKLLKFLSAKL